MQTGATVEIIAKVGPVSLAGFLGYDAILILSSLLLRDGMRAGVKMKFKGHTLASVKLKLHLEGPGRWLARGTVSFTILWWDVEKGFDEAWVASPRSNRSAHGWRN